MKLNPARKQKLADYELFFIDFNADRSGQPTPNNPVLFFERFFENSLIIKKQESFTEIVSEFTNAEHIHPLTKHVSYISPDNQEINFSFDVYETRPLRKTILTTRTDVITFDQVLNYNLTKEYLLSVKLLSKKHETASGKSSEESKWIKLIQEIYIKLQTYYVRIETDDTYTRFKAICIKPLRALLNEIYTKYSTALIGLEFLSRLKSLPPVITDTSDLPKKKIITPEDLQQLFHDLHSQKIIKGRPVFTSVDPTKSIASLVSLFSKKTIKGHKGKIELYGKKGVFNYTIGLIAEKLGIERTEISKKKCLYIQDRLFDNANCDREYSRYPKKYPKESSELVYLVNLHLE